LAVEKGAGHSDEHQRRVSGDFFVSRFSAVTAETCTDLSDPFRYLVRASAARIEELLAQWLTVGPFRQSTLAQIVAIIAP